MRKPDKYDVKWWLLIAFTAWAWYATLFQVGNPSTAQANQEERVR